jgi:esterase
MAVAKQDFELPNVCQQALWICGVQKQAMRSYCIVFSTTIILAIVLYANGLALPHTLIKKTSWSGNSNAPVVVLHGLLGSRRALTTWCNNVHEALGGRIDVLSVDLRNHGDNPNLGESPISYSEMSDDVEQTIRDIGVGRAHFVGHSMGGKVAAALAMQRPSHSSHLVASLTMLDIMPLHYASGSAFDGVRSAVSMLNVIDDLAGRGESAEAVQRCLEELISDQSMRSFVKSNMRWRNGRLAWSFNLPAITNSLDAVAASPASLLSTGGQVPTMILKAQHSDFVQLSRAQEIEGLFSRCRIETVPDVGHWLHVEKPRETADIVARFIESLDSRLTVERKAAVVAEELVNV